MRFISKRDEKLKDWHEYTFIMPTVSIGNVGQLTVDLLISTLQARLVGYISSDCVIPVVGRDAFDFTSNLLTTSLDIYESEEKKLVILQQRSPFIKNRQQRYLDELMEWFLSMKFKNIIIFTSTLACERIDSQLYGPQCRFLTSTNDKQIDIDRLSKLLPKLEPRLDIDHTGGGDSGDSNAQPYIPGSGIAKKLLRKCNSENIPALIFMRFSYEADNIPDAVELFNLSNSYFNWIDPEKDHLKMPPSWRLLFGSHFDQIIYQ